MAHERPDIADNLVNYVIALESLYFIEPTSEMKQKFANRIANLLGRNPEEKTAIRNTMLDIYRVRCEYVHGGISEIPNRDRKGFNDYLRNILRISLLSFFSLSTNYNSNKKRERLLKSLDSVFAISLIENIHKGALDFLSLTRPYDFINRKDKD